MKTVDAYKEIGRNRVIVFLKNGFQMKGTLTRVFDDGGVEVEDDNSRKNIIPPAAISTVQPC